MTILLFFYNKYEEDVSIETVDSIFATTISVVEKAYNIDDIEDEINNEEILSTLGENSEDHFCKIESLFVIIYVLIIFHFTFQNKFHPAHGKKDYFVYMRPQ